MKQSAPEDMYAEIEQLISEAEDTLRKVELELSRFVGIA